MKILIIGNGGREHALGWRLSLDDSGSHDLLFAPGNPGTARLGRNFPVDVSDLQSLVDLAKREDVEFTIVGPELPLSLGIVDAFQAEDLVIFGPSQAAAQMEASKNFAKDVMNAAGVANARHEYFTNAESAVLALEQFSPPYVVKADGLAAGKGVVVTEDRAEAQDVIESHFAKGSDGQGVLLEQFLAGREASFIVMTDGERILPFPASNDYKRIFDNDEGPNTGGMGTVSPTAHLSPQLESRIVGEVIRPVLQELKRRDIPFVGFLYAGLMISPSNEVQVIEFNARLGDPETQVILRRWQGNLARTLYGLASGGELPPQEHSEDKAAVCIVLASHGYPQSSRKGDVISGVAEAESLGNVVVFHAGTAEQEGKLVTAGGRVLGVTAIGETVQEARLKAYEAVERITFDGLQYRSDIACNQE